MNGSESVLEPTTSTGVTGASFQLVRRGYDPLEVQAFARAVSAELQRLARENEELRAEVRRVHALGAQPQHAHQPVAPAPAPAPVDEATVAQYLGSETTRLLQAARDTAAGIIHRAEQRADEVVAVAEHDARRIRDEGVGEAAHERRVAADEARKLIADATDHRRTTLAELARRRDLASSQLRELMRGRDVLMTTLRDVSTNSGELVGRLEDFSLGHGDFVNLDPSIADRDAGLDHGAVLKVDFAPPTPNAVVAPPATPVRQRVPGAATSVFDLGGGAAAAAASAASAASSSARPTFNHPFDKDDTLFILEG